MRKLMIFSFAILFSVLAVLSLINYSYDGVDKIEADKQSITIKKPSDVTNEQFLNNIDNALSEINADIMYRYVSVVNNKVHYGYYRTTHTSDYISLGGQYDNISLTNTECVSTIRPDGYMTYPLLVSSVFQNITFYNWNNAAAYDLSSCTYLVDKGRCDEIANVITTLGYEVTIQSGTTVSGKMPIVLFSFIPICLMIMSMVFYVLSNGKKNVLKKMEGYLSRNILFEELRSNGKIFLLVLFAIEMLNIIIAAFVFRTAVFQYIFFMAEYMLIGLITLAIGIMVALVFIFGQRGSVHIKGKAPKKTMYYMTMVVKCVFVVFIAFFMSIGVRNVQLAYNTFTTSSFIAEKVGEYVTIPIFENNASSRGLEDNYLAFYNATVDEYNGVLVDAGNYEVDVSTGRTLCELYGQEEITVNTNYLTLNPIFDLDGNTISENDFVAGAINILIPETKIDRMEKYNEFAMIAYSKQANFIIYDAINTNVYSYNATTGSGSYGEIDQPIIVVVNAEDLEGIFVLSYCSYGAYFINPHTNDPYSELLPLLKEVGIDTVTPQTPYILSNFDEVLNQQFQMLLLYGTQTIVLSIGLACLILFSTKLYCENYRNRIACCLIEGYPLSSCIKQHIVVIAISCLITLLAASYVGNAMQVGINYYIVVGASFIELISTFIICKKYTKSKLHEIVKGAE